MKQKGINVATADFEAAMAELINNCALPASTIRLVLVKLLGEIVNIEQKLVEQERAEYEKSEECTE